jgi:hypothetical protein
MTEPKSDVVRGDLAHVAILLKYLLRATNTDLYKAAMMEIGRYDSNLKKRKIRQAEWLRQTADPPAAQ